MAIQGRLAPQRFPHILNSVNYANAGELYNTTADTRLKEGKQGSFRKRSGIAVTITIPPTLDAFRYFRVVNALSGNPHISYDDKQKIIEYNRLFKAAKKAAKTDLGRKKARLKFSTEFEITDFITALTWSSADENAFINMDITLDNAKGLFNYLPEGTKVTLWRRKALNNINGLQGGRWYRYITSYVATKSRTASGRSQTMAINCGDRLSFAGAQKLKEGIKWTKGKKNHKKGWTPREITLDVCKRAGIPVNAAKIPSKIRTATKVTTNADGTKIRSYTYVNLPPINYEPGDVDVYSILIGAWRRSLDKLPKKQQLPYNLHMREGVLVCEFVGPPGHPLSQVTDPDSAAKDDKTLHLVPMFLDRDNIESITLDESIEPSQVWTQLHAVGWIPGKKKPNKTGKLVTTKVKVKGTFLPSADNLVRQELIVAAYGKRTTTHKFKKSRLFKDKKEFNVAAQAKADALARPVRTLDLEGRAPLGIWPNYYVNIDSRYAGVFGDVRVKTVSYTVTEGNITVSLTLDVLYKHISKASSDLEKKITNANKPTPDEVWY